MFRPVSSGLSQIGAPSPFSADLFGKGADQLSGMQAPGEILGDGNQQAGFVVGPETVRLLGAGTFPSPGSMAEKFWLAAVEIDDPAAQEAPRGDGSPMEEGVTTRWMELDQAIDACLRGEIEDAKSELTLRRLRDWLG